MSLRKLLLYLHLITGFAGAIILLLLGGSGAVMVFENEIDHALNAKLSYVTPQAQRLTLDELTQALRKTYPDARVTSFSLSAQPDIAFTASLRDKAGKGFGVAINPYTGVVLGELSEANLFTRKLHQFHKNLLLGEKGKLITGIGAILLLVLSLTGAILWWPQKIWNLRAKTSGARVNYDLHNLAGIYSLVYLMAFSLTGIVIHWEEASLRVANQITNSSPPPPIPRAEPLPKGTLPISATQAEMIAEAAVPGAKVSSVQLGNPIRITMKYPEDATPAGRTNVYLDPATGKILFLQTSRTAPLGTRMVKLWNREIHTGDIFGWPTRLIACACSLLLPLLALTGPLIWWSRRRKKLV